MKVIVSVPGKIILMGDHAIVHGKPALLSGVNMRMVVAIESIEQGEEVVTTEDPIYVHQILEVVKREQKIDAFPPFRLTITSAIPAGYHLGSSAATAVGVTGAMIYFAKKLWNPAVINKVAYEAEKLQHGNPSGGDNTSITMGGLVWYRKELEFLKSMWQLPFRPKLTKYFLIDTGRPVESTGEMVAYVSAKCKMKNSQWKMQKIFDENEVQTKRVAVALKEGNEKELIDAIRKGEATLEQMGVVSNKAISLIRAIEASGGAAKILGGGGKKDGVGFVLAYHPDEHILSETISTLGYEMQSIQLGEEGIRLEQKN